MQSRRGARAQVQKKALTTNPNVLLGPGYWIGQGEARLAAEAGIAQIMGGEAAELTQGGKSSCSVRRSDSSR